MEYLGRKSDVSDVGSRGSGLCSSRFASFAEGWAGQGLSLGCSFPPLSSEWFGLRFTCASAVWWWLVEVLC